MLTILICAVAFILAGMKLVNAVNEYNEKKQKRLREKEEDDD